MAIGERGERDVGPARSRRSISGKQRSSPVDRAVRDTSPRERRTAQRRRSPARRSARPASASQTTLACGRSALGQRLREPALQPERGEQRGEFDHDDREREAAERVRAVERPAMNRNGIRAPAAARSRRNWSARPWRACRCRWVGQPRAFAPPPPTLSIAAPDRRRRSPECAMPAASMRRAPARAGADLDAERHVELDRRLGGASPSRARSPAWPPRPRPRALRTPVRHGPGAACARRSARRRPAPGSIRAIARLMMSALVPWIGALIAARSAPWRSCWILRLDPREVRLAAEQGGGEAASRARCVERLGDVAVDAREALEIAVDDRLRLVGGRRPAGRPGPSARCRRGSRS